MSDSDLLGLLRGTRDSRSAELRCGGDHLPGTQPLGVALERALAAA